MYIGLHIKYLLFLSDLNETWIFLTDFKKILKYHVMEIHPVGAETFQTQGQTDMTKLIVAFCNSAKMPKNKNT